MQIWKKTKVLNQGFTLIETVIAILLLAMLLGVTGFVFIASLHAWDAGCLRTGIREDMSYAMEKTVRDLKGMTNASLRQYSLIAHTIQCDDSSGTTYVFYLYNVDDSSFDSTYSESFYDLRKANISSGDDPASGGGLLILQDLVSPDTTPPATALSIDPNDTQVTLDFVVQRGDETVRLKTKIRPRNL